MLKSVLPKMSRGGLRAFSPAAPKSSISVYKTMKMTFTPVAKPSLVFQPASRSISMVPSIRNFSPSSEKPIPNNSENKTSEVMPANLTIEQYHKLSEEYMDLMLEKFEFLQDERVDVDVDYYSGVLTLVLPPHGTYVINKQPPNKQIWLSSPISGPKRYDYVVMGEDETSKDKEGPALGQWVYIRDKTTLQDLILKETGVDIGAGPKDFDG